VWVAIRWHSIGLAAEHPPIHMRGRSCRQYLQAVPAGTAVTARRTVTVHNASCIMITMPYE